MLIAIIHQRWLLTYKQQRRNGLGVDKWGGEPTSLASFMCPLSAPLHAKTWFPLFCATALLLCFYFFMRSAFTDGLWLGKTPRKVVFVQSAVWNKVMLSSHSDPWADVRGVRARCWQLGGSRGISVRQGQGCPVPGKASSSRLRWTHRRTQLRLAVMLVAPLGKYIWETAETLPGSEEWGKLWETVLQETGSEKEREEVL